MKLTVNVRAIASAIVVVLLAFAGVTAEAGQAHASADIYDVLQIVSWDGYCLSIPNANIGTRLDQVPCGEDHLWWLNTVTGKLYPQGHPDAEVGDSGGYLELKAAGTGTKPYCDTPDVPGPTGNGYCEVWFNVAGTYWHADGDGLDVTFDSEKGDLANYWWLDPIDLAPCGTPCGG
ncbi:MAG TPA: hypothetical protein VL551_08030 [Actinospica sp.]|jgi:hypothetical protein|nr:hypothetical protein [Actinospica sp.]